MTYRRSSSHRSVERSGHVRLRCRNQSRAHSRGTESTRSIVPNAQNANRPNKLSSASSTRPNIRISVMDQRADGSQTRTRALGERRLSEHIQLASSLAMPAKPQPSARSPIQDTHVPRNRLHRHARSRRTARPWPKSCARIKRTPACTICRSRPKHPPESFSEAHSAQIALRYSTGCTCHS